MFKLLVVAVILAAPYQTYAGIIGLGSHGVISVPLATSYQENNQLSLNPTAVVVSKAIPAIAQVAVAQPVAVGLGHGIIDGRIGIGALGLGAVGQLGGLGLKGGIW